MTTGRINQVACRAARPSPRNPQRHRPNDRTRKAPPSHPLKGATKRTHRTRRWLQHVRAQMESPRQKDARGFEARARTDALQQSLGARTPPRRDATAQPPRREPRGRTATGTESPLRPAKAPAGLARRAAPKGTQTPHRAPTPTQPEPKSPGRTGTRGSGGS